MSGEAPTAGGFAIIKNWSGYGVREVDRATLKLVFLKGWNFPRQIKRKEVVFASADRAGIELLCQAINGAHGTLQDRVRKSSAEHSARCVKAQDSFDATLQRLIGQHAKVSDQ